MTTYRITALRAKNFKRLHDIAIRPEADAAIVLIGGKNANGKSSVLDALSTAFGGKKLQPTDPVRHGADAASIEVDVVDVDAEGSQLELRRSILPDGESTLEVRDRLGALKAPQTMLDKLVAGRFLDPLAFLNLPAKEQRARLMTLIPDAKRIDSLNEKRQRAFDRRTEVGRDLTKAEGELARTPEPVIAAPVDVAAITAEIDELARQQRAGDGLGHSRDRADRALREVSYRATTAQDRASTLGERITQLESELARLRRDLEAATAEAAAAAAAVEDARIAAAAAADQLAAAAKAWSETGAPRRTALDAELSRAADHNRAVFAAEAQRDRRAMVLAEVEKLRAERTELTGLLETIDNRKAEVLAAAKLPVDGLAIADDGIELNGVPLAQASDAERWRVALALAIAANPGLADIWIRDGALLDEDSMEIVARQAAEAGRRLWIEIVSTATPGTIVIRDGRVAGKTVAKESGQQELP